LGKQFFLPAVTLTDAALEEVALDGTLEKAFGHGDDNPGGKVRSGRDGPRGGGVVRADRTRALAGGTEDILAAEAAV